MANPIATEAIADARAHTGALPVRLFRFVLETHPPASYLVLSCLWSFSVMFTCQQRAGGAHLDVAMLAVSASFFLVLLFLRAIDEIKDLGYDRVHNTARPLVCGDVSVTEVWLLAVLVAATVCAVNFCMSPTLALFLAAEMLYGLGLMALEHASRYFRESILLNLVVTFPVSAALNVYAILYLHDREMSPAWQDAIPVVVAHIAAFLHFEFGRKLKWPQFASPGENGYALVFGGKGAVAVCACLGLLACILSTAVHWRQGGRLIAMLPWVAMLPSVLGFAGFLLTKDAHRDLKPFFVGFLLLFFASNIVAAF